MGGVQFVVRLGTSPKLKVDSSEELGPSAQLAGDPAAAGLSVSRHVLRTGVLCSVQYSACTPLLKQRVKHLENQTKNALHHFFVERKMGYTAPLSPVTASDGSVPYGMGLGQSVADRRVALYASVTDRFQGYMKLLRPSQNFLDFRRHCFEI